MKPKVVKPKVAKKINNTYIKKKFLLDSFSKKKDYIDNVYSINSKMIKIDLSVPMYFGDSQAKEKLAIIF